MPRYFFHLQNDMFVEDDEGAELPDLAGAREYALEAARELICIFVKQGQLNLSHFIRVTDEAGEDVLRLTFGDSVSITR